MNRPTPPHLEFDAVAQVLMHPSCASNQDDPTYGNAARLASIGKKVLVGAYTDVICGGGPGNSRRAPEIEILDIVDGSIENVIQDWATAYGWRARGVSPNSQLDQAEENRRIFCAYVGAVFISPGGGYSAVRQWIAALTSGSPPSPAEAPWQKHSRRKGPHLPWQGTTGRRVWPIIMRLCPSLAHGQTSPPIHLLHMGMPWRRPLAAAKPVPRPDRRRRRQPRRNQSQRTSPYSTRRCSRTIGRCST
ncbi:hypothetical protein C8Q78DRAFT_362327 [Trametes maxima]|nr:hypothetical protein C8Q78DRAFT_362327 [Trametes maxima]